MMRLYTGLVRLKNKRHSAEECLCDDTLLAGELSITKLPYRERERRG
jgi:hypothetical protein